MKRAPATKRDLKCILLCLESVCLLYEMEASWFKILLHDVLENLSIQDNWVGDDVEKWYGSK